MESLSLCCDINLPSLKKLSLVGVVIDDQMIQNLVAGSPVISIGSCFGLKTIHFSGLPKVKAIQLESNDELKTVELETSNLCYLCIKQMEAFKINMVACKNLKILKLKAGCITDKCLNYCISQLPLIEYLSLSRCYMLERIKISSHCLKTLYLRKCNKLIEFEIDTPKLCKLTYSGRNTISFSVKKL
jgi:hypothetical protein